MWQSGRGHRWQYNVAKCGRAREVIVGNIIRRMRLACWMTRLGVRLYVQYIVWAAEVIDGNIMWQNVAERERS